MSRYKSNSFVAPFVVLWLIAPSGIGNSLPVHAADPRADQVAVVQLAVESLPRSTTQPAHVEPFERTDIYAKAAGYVSKVNVDIGERVQQGQVLAQLLIPEMDQELIQKAALVDDARAAVEQAQANLVAAAAVVAAAEAQLAVTKATIAQREAEVAFRRAEHERIGKLVASRSMNEALLDEKLNQMRSSESALDGARANVQSAAANVKVEEAHWAQAEADLARAQAQLHVAEADRKQTEVLMEYSKIVAPYDGLVTRRWIDTGDFVRSAASSMTEPLFTVIQDDKLRIVFDVPESQSSQVRVGQPASLVVDALKERTFDGHVKRTTGILDPQTRTLRGEVEIDRADTGLRPGMFGTITIVLADNP